MNLYIFIFYLLFLLVPDVQLSNEDNIAEPEYSENSLKIGMTEFDIESESSDSDNLELLDIKQLVSIYHFECIIAFVFLFIYSSVILFHFEYA